MKKLSSFASLAALSVYSPLFAQETQKPKMLSPGQIVDAAAPKEWKAIAAGDLLVVELEPDTIGKERQVIVQLMPPPFSQAWIRNIRKLAKANWWDGTSINRVQDNYVVQWGDPAEEESKRKPLPKGLRKTKSSQYAVSMHRIETNYDEFIANSIPTMTVDYTLKYDDPYTSSAGFRKGWPIAHNDKKAWPVHCYGTVGVGRGLSPDAGSGAELYAVIGHSPRHLDRNIAVVGRVIDGMHHLSSLPRGFGPLGFYETPDERVPIKSIRLANELFESNIPKYEYLSARSKSFRQYAEARANRRDPFFIKPAGGADVCNIPVPVRRVAGK